MKITIQEDDIDKAKRIISCDEAYSLLWNLDQKMRGWVKYGVAENKSYQDLLNELRDDIGNSNLLDLWT